MKKILSILSLIIISMLLFTSVVNADMKSIYNEVEIINFNLVGTPISEVTQEEVKEILDGIEEFESKYNSLAFSFPNFVRAGEKYKITTSSSVKNNGISIQIKEMTREKSEKVQKEMLKKEEEIKKLKEDAEAAQKASQDIIKKAQNGEEVTKEEYIEALETYVEKVNLYYAKAKEREEYIDSEIGLYDDTKWQKTTEGEFTVKESDFCIYARIDSEDENGNQKYIYSRMMYSVDIIKGLVVEPEKKTLKIGETFKINISSGNENNEEVTYESNNTSVATVGNDGTVKGIGEGTATITTKVGNKTASTVVTVTKDTTIAGGKIPQTGIRYFGIAFVIVLIIGTIYWNKRYKRIDR